MGLGDLDRLEPSVYDTQSMRRTKVAPISNVTVNQQAVRLLLGHTKMDEHNSLLGADIEDALTLAEGIDRSNLSADARRVGQP